MKSRIIRLFQKKIIYIVLYSLLVHSTSELLLAFEQPSFEKTLQAAAIHTVTKKSDKKKIELEEVIALFQEIVERITRNYCSADQLEQVYTELYQLRNELIAMRQDNESLTLPDFKSITSNDIANITHDICTMLVALKRGNDLSQDTLEERNDESVIDDVLYRASCVQNRIVIILLIVQTIESKLDACCFTLASLIDNISVSVACDLSSVFTALQQVDNDVLTVSSKLDACCFTLNSKIDHLSINATCDLSSVFTALQQVDNDVLTVSSKLDACCFTLNSKIDHLSINATCDFSTIFTALQKIDNDVLTVSSKVDNLTNIVNVDFNSTFTALNALNNLITNEFNGTFTALNACCFTLNSKIDHLSINATCDFSTIFTALQKIDNDVLTVSSKVDNLTNIVNVDFNSTFTALNALNNLITNEFNGTFTALNACCFTLNSKIDHLSINATCDFSTIFTALQKIDNDVLTVSSKVDNLTNIVNVDFNNTFTALNALNNLIINEFNGTFTALNACCFTLNSKADVMLSKLAIIDTNIDILLGDFQQTWTILGALNFTLNSRLDIITTDLIGCCTAIGSTSDLSVGCEVLTTTAAIDAANLSVISWLKTIYRDMRGFSSCS